MTLCTNCNIPVKPVVAIDIDGTLARYHESFITFTAAYLNQYEKLNHWLTYDGCVELSDFLGLPKYEYREIKLAFRQGGNKRWMEAFGGAETFMALVKDLGVELWVTTTRPWQRLDNVDPDTRHWLDRRGIAFDHLIYDENKYQMLLDMVGHGRVVAVLDDELEQYEIAESLGLFPILRRTCFNRGRGLRVQPRPRQAQNFPEAYALIQQAVTAWHKEH